MDIKRIATRGVLFTFYDLKQAFDSISNVYVINGKKYIFICDTFIGPEAMAQVKAYIDANLPKKPIVIFNSHSDWDHIWGNCFFKGETIIAQELCRENIIKNGESELKKFNEFQSGRVEITLPNLTFSKRIRFNDEKIEFFFSPGHTEDSATCFDEVDRVLYTGDNLERPLPRFLWWDLKQYADTLDRYSHIKWRTQIPAHSDINDAFLIKDNLEYIQKFIANDTKQYEVDPFKKSHFGNLKVIAEFRN